ncbi:MAG: CpsD/CapB family tyrosine-protein kinase [Candidatus Eisenbacteria bacterium]|nr:CpsD/CapB family tyrosine-protein kinase [Candidatus Eisenbacteria bacterium]
MTRIFDALKKAEASRQAPAHAPAVVNPLPAAAPHVQGLRVPSRGPEAQHAALPLLGGLPMSEEVVREMMSLRVTLDVTLRDRMPRIVMFTSPQGGEGTSTIALQFAQILGRDSGLRPLLVDTHVRRPAYEPDPSRRCAVLSPGLVEDAPDQAAVLAPNLLVVPVPEPQRANGIYQPAALRQLLEQLGSDFDWIVLDGPPVLESPDASAIGSIADGVVLVVQAGRSKRPVLSRAAELLRKSGSQVLGSVLNRRVHEIPEFIYRRI